ncbi:MAG: 50S ribosomal protein L21 [Candidatus Saccharimonadales bacterium]
MHQEPKKPAVRPALLDGRLAGAKLVTKKVGSKMKKAVIATGGKQYVVAEGDTLSIERLSGDGKKVSFDALLVVDGDKTTVGAPLVKGAVVKATVVDAEAKAEKVTAIRYKAKKRVHKVHGHRQQQTIVKIDSIG